LTSLGGILRSSQGDISATGKPSSPLNNSWLMIYCTQVVPVLA
jgi:hypothetical protein